jgi:50S ribosomal subunit-associated GTPase HflX
VNRVLAETGAADLPQILVFNKIDRTTRRASTRRIRQGEPRLAVRRQV